MRKAERMGMNEDDQHIEELMRFIAWIAKLRLPAGQAARVNSARDLALGALEGTQTIASFGGTKLSTGPLSPGCLTCGQGTWSCLFLTGICTADCVFCPQDLPRREHSPLAEGIRFEEPAAYADYLQRFGFRGVSFSGGEPLLAHKRLLAYVDAIRARCGDEMIIWVYTNGDLADQRRLSDLSAAGVNEIRFDISAREYDLAPVELARRTIRTITVEIPALPEDLERLKASLVALEQIGIDHLNLHQLVATQHNYRRLQGRGYTFLRPEAFREPPVLESEMAALELLRFAGEEGLKLPINYCSHVYKARYQELARRRRAAEIVRTGPERVTEAGYICQLAIEGDPARIRSIMGALAQHGIDERHWLTVDDGARLTIDPSLLRNPALTDAGYTLRYFEADIVQRSGPRTAREIALHSGRIVYVDRWQVADRPGLSRAAIADLVDPRTASIAEAGSDDRSLATGRAGQSSRALDLLERTPSGLPVIA